ncbi:MAG: glycosyltransferase family 39 protein [Dehalococcoidia bacterium]|nr:glycosyltransferase family 39 protein [Dehalococcoidia bacterium]
MTRPSRKQAVFLALVLLAAFALRIYRIEYQSIWGDEAYSIWRSALPLYQIPWQVAKTGNLAPLYYFLLHFWQGIAGPSELAIRSFSLFFGILALPVAYKLMARLHNRESGLLVALLGAASPFWVYYSQEAKMYAQMAFLVLLSSYLFLRAFDRNSGGSTDAAPTRARYQRGGVWLYLAYGLASAAAIYTHYFAIFAILAHGAYLLAYRRLRLGIRPWLASLSLAAVLVLPWALYAASALTWAGSSIKRGSIGLDTILSQVFRAFAVGNFLEGDLLPWVLGVALALVFLGLLAASGRTRLFLLLGIVLPVLGVYLVSFIPHPGWSRYFMAASPAYYGLVAAGLAYLYRRHFALGTAALLVLVPSGLSLANYYFDPQFARYDYRTQIRELVSSSTPEDGVIANGPEDFPAFFYYFDRSIPYYVLPNLQISSRTDIEAFLGSLRRSGLWLVKYMPPDFDTDNAIEDWLKRNAFPLETKWVENVTFTYYSLPQEHGDPVPGAQAPATFEKGVRLLGYRAQTRPWGKRSILQLTLLWQTDQKVDSAYTVFVHALDGASQKVGQGDGEPVGGLSPTTAWKPGELVVDRHGVLLPQGFNTEGARLEVGLYDLKSGTRLQMLDDNGRPGGTALVLPLP